MTYAGGTVLGPGVVTSEFKINYVRPAMGEWLVARAVVVHAGKSLAIAQGTIARLAEPAGAARTTHSRGDGRASPSMR